jgi:hypothetical protein
MVPARGNRAHSPDGVHFRAASSRFTLARLHRRQIDEDQAPGPFARRRLGVTGRTQISRRRRRIAPGRKRTSWCPPGGLVRWKAPRATIAETSYAPRVGGGAENQSGTPTSRSANESVGPGGPNAPCESHEPALDRTRLPRSRHVWITIGRRWRARQCGIVFHSETYDEIRDRSGCRAIPS